MEQLNQQEAAFTEPAPLEVFLTRVLLGTIGRGVYRRHVDSLGLTGAEKVIDYGSGAGIGATYLASKLTKGGSLTCVDISQRWLAEAKRRLKKYRNVDFRHGDICLLDLPDGVYDAVVISFVLHDIPEGGRLQKLRCLVKKLRRGGKIFVREPTSGNEGITPGEVRSLMAGCGMEEVTLVKGSIPLMGPTFDATYVKR